MILCFIYGGVSLLLFFSQTYLLIRMGEFQSSQIPRRGILNLTNRTHIGFWGGSRTAFFYPVIVISFLGSVISILAGLSLMDLLKKKERKKLTKDLINTMTTPEEKLILKELEEAGGELTQSELVRKTNLSRVKVHRIVKRLERLEIISKYPYGVTNKIKLEKKLMEEE